MSLTLRETALLARLSAMMPGPLPAILTRHRVGDLHDLCQEAEICTHCLLMVLREYEAAGWEEERLKALEEELFLMPPMVLRQWLQAHECKERMAQA